MKSVRYIVAIVIVVAAWCVLRHQNTFAPRNICIGNLIAIQRAKSLWQTVNKRAASDVPVMDDVTNYMSVVPVCPAGGTYTLGPIGKNPTCSVKGHELPKDKAY